VKKTELNKFRKLLTEQRVELLEKAKKTLEQDMALDVNELPDDMDFASTQSDQGITLRLRGREKTLLKKIDDALKRIETNEFGICEECGEDISSKRLEARPVTTLCIRCKQEQERKEKMYV
jgi:DnaK suppressor protein